MIVTELGRKIYFQLTDGGLPVAGTRRIEPVELGRLCLPKPGDRIVFRVSNKPWTGQKAAPWCFADDWEKAQKSLAVTQSESRPVARSSGRHNKAVARAR